MMEKPLAVSNEHARRIADAAAEGGIQVLVNYETTWYASNHAVFRAVQAGSLGPVRKMVVHDGHRGPKEIGVQPEFLRWLTDPVQNGGGALFDFGCYGANLFTWLMGNARPVSVTAVTQTFKPDGLPARRRRGDDRRGLAGRRRRSSRPRGTGRSTARTSRSTARTGQALTVKTEAVRLRLEGKDESGGRRHRRWRRPKTISCATSPPSCAARSRPSGLSSLENNLVVTEILDAARESARTGRTVTLAAGR